MLTDMDETTYRHIVVAIDGSRESQAALEQAARLARASNASLDLLAVSSVPSTTYWGGVVQPMELVEQVYANIVRCAAASVPDIPVTTYLVKGHPAGAIVKHAAEHCCDLIVVGTRGRAGVLAALLGSTARAVTRRAHVPVLVVQGLVDRDAAPDEAVIQAAA
jgi:nucleotide-binding universal stress UspA family protein